MLYKVNVNSGPAVQSSGLYGSIVGKQLCRCHIFIHHLTDQKDQNILIRPKKSCLFPVTLPLLKP